MTNTVGPPSVGTSEPTRAAAGDSFGGILWHSLIVTLVLGLPFFLFLALKVTGLYDCLRYPQSADDAASAAVSSCWPGYPRYVAHEWLALISLAMAFGALGSAVSVISRINTGLLAFNEINAERFKFTVFMFLGAIFGLLLFMLFVGGLVQGSLFPSFATSYRWIELSINIDDWAKLIVWCFLAGFSERLMPNLLANLIGRAEAARSQPEGSTAAPATVTIDRGSPAASTP